MHATWLTSISNRLFDFICLWILPVGYLLLLSGLFFMPDRSLHQKLFYSLFSAPAFIALCLRPGHLKALLREPLVIAFLAFALWCLLSLLWSHGDDKLSDLLKRPLHTFMLYVGCMLLIRYRSESLRPILFVSALIALAATLIDLYVFVKGGGERMIGGGAFDNPLLSSHVLGFFAVYWLSLCMTTRRLPVFVLSGLALAVMFGAVLATGSRTPLVALGLAALWLAFICWNRRSLLLVGAMLIGGVAIMLLFSNMIFERGDSYRFELWRLALEQIYLHPWLGHGYNSLPKLAIEVGTFQEPHDFALGVLYYVGILGFIPWAFMQAWALISSWQQRAEPLFIMASTWLAFGIGAGLTEGGGVLSQPKEHWFLLWIPLALVAALSIANRTRHLHHWALLPLDVLAADQLYAEAQIIEADGLGPKVLRLADGTFLKLFRRRRWYTSGRFNPYAARFANNSQRLQAMGLPAPTIINVFSFADGSSAVHYHPLAGSTLRQVLKALSIAEQRQALVNRFGEFLGCLHEQGVYFRSVHLGNVLVLENGEFGLIDLADMRLMPSPLRRQLRQRNLRHIQRYADDRAWLFDEHFEALLSGYAAVASPGAIAALRAQVSASKRIGAATG